MEPVIFESTLQKPKTGTIRCCRREGEGKKTSGVRSTAQDGHRRQPGASNQQEPEQMYRRGRQRQASRTESERNIEILNQIPCAASVVDTRCSSAADGQFVATIPLVHAFEHIPKRLRSLSIPKSFADHRGHISARGIFIHRQEIRNQLCGLPRPQRQPCCSSSLLSIGRLQSLET